MSTAKRQRPTRKRCPSCGGAERRHNALCKKCTPPVPAPAPKTKPVPLFARGTWKVCPACGHKGTRAALFCKRCDPTRSRPTCPQCGKDKDYRAASCAACRGDFVIDWTAEKDAFLREHYPARGAQWVAAKMALPVLRVRGRANHLKISLTKEATRRIVHDAAARHMREHNPSHLPGASERLRRQSANHPETLVKLFAGHAKLQRDKPSKLELRLFAILGKLGVAYESHAIIKPKFIVDAKVGNLIIEADGDWWHGHPRFETLNERQLAQKKRDAARNAYLTACGFQVARIWESDMSEATVTQILRHHNLLPNP